MATVESVTAFDVTRELVATKIAIVELLGDATGEDTYGLEALNEWAFASPFDDDPLDLLGELLDHRVHEIRLEMAEAIGNHFLAQADRLRKLRDHQGGE